MNTKNLAAENNFLTADERDIFFKRRQVLVELPTKEICMNLTTDPYTQFMYEMVQKSAQHDAEVLLKKSKYCIIIM